MQKVTLGGIGDDIFSAVTNVVGMVPGLGTVAALAAKGIKTGIDAATGHDPNAPGGGGAPAPDPTAHLQAELHLVEQQRDVAVKKEKQEAAALARETKMYQELARHEKIEKRVLFGMGAVIVVGGVTLAVKAFRRRHA